MHGEHRRRDADLRDRREILHRIVRHLGVEAGIDRVGRDRRDQQRVAVRRGLRDLVGADIAARADLVLDEELLAEQFRELGGEDAPDDVGRPAGRERHHDANGPVGILSCAWPARSPARSATMAPNQMRSRPLRNAILILPDPNMAGHRRAKRNADWGKRNPRIRCGRPTAWRARYPERRPNEGQPHAPSGKPHRGRHRRRLRHRPRDRDRLCARGRAGRRARRQRRGGVRDRPANPQCRRQGAGLHARRDGSRRLPRRRQGCRRASSARSRSW